MTYYYIYVIFIAKIRCIYEHDYSKQTLKDKDSTSLKNKIFYYGKTKRKDITANIIINIINNHNDDGYLVVNYKIELLKNGNPTEIKNHNGNTIYPNSIGVTYNQYYIQKSEKVDKTVDIPDFHNLIDIRFKILY